MPDFRIPRRDWNAPQHLTAHNKDLQILEYLGGIETNSNLGVGVKTGGILEYLGGIETSIGALRS